MRKIRVSVRMKEGSPLPQAPAGTGSVSVSVVGCGGCNGRKVWLNKKTGSLRLGDKVEAVTKATGIKAVVDGFAERRARRKGNDGSKRG